MPDFAYTALAATGLASAGTITAGSEREAALLLDAKGLFPTQIAVAKAPGGGFSIGGGVGPRQMATTYSQMADLLHSGVPLLRSLELLERQTANKRLQSVLREVRMDVAEGTGLSQAMARHPKVFNELVVSMVRAGQEGGFLEDVLKRTAAFVEQQEDLKAKVIGSMAYPLFLMFAGGVVMVVLMVGFVPRFEKIFDKLRQAGELPTLTKIVMGISNFMIGWWWLILGLIVGAVVGYVAWVRTPAGRMKMDQIRLKMPMFGKIYLNLALSRFARILGTMLHNGIPLLKALGIAKDSTGNKVLTEAIEESAENITAGAKLADPLRRNKHFPTDMVEMIAIAEESNNLEKVLLDVADSMERRTARNLELMVKLLEPVMMLFMAGGVLAVVLGLLLPVFKIGQTLK